jgi:hypothetical protein
MNRKRRRVHFSVESEINAPEGTRSLIESSTPESRCSAVQIVAEAGSRSASCTSDDFLNEPEVCYGGVGLPILVLMDSYHEHAEPEYPHRYTIYL